MCSKEARLKTCFIILGSFTKQVLAQFMLSSSERVFILNLKRLTKNTFQCSPVWQLISKIHIAFAVFTFSERAFAYGHVHIFFTVFNILGISNLWFQFPFLIPFWHWAHNCSIVQCEPGVAVIVAVVVSFVLWKQPQLSSAEWSAAWRVLSLHSSLFGSHTLCHSEPRPYIHPALGTPPLWEWAHLKSLQEFLVQASQRYLHLFQSHRFYRSIETVRISNMRVSFSPHCQLHHPLGFGSQSLIHT